MTTVTIALPEPLKSFVESEVKAGGYGSTGEYVRELIRRDRDRRLLRALLIEGPASGPGEVVDDAWFDALRASVRTSGAA